MFIQGVSLQNFRSCSELSLRVGPGLTVLVGPNGAGKTTVLEAIVLALRGDPLRGGAVRDMIAHGQDHLRVEIGLVGESGSTTAAAAYTSSGERRLTSDGLALPDPSRWLDILPIRTFIPDDLRLIKGSPRRRRAYLDTLAQRQDRGYMQMLRSYEEALAQRNVLLRVSRRGGHESQFAPWERILAEAGAEIRRVRSEALGSFVAAFQAMHRDLTGEPADNIRLKYRTNVADLDMAEYQVRLEEARDSDRQRTYTNLGPHRDDFRLIREALDMKECASQGEQRAALLTLVLAEWEHLRRQGRAPLLLLDDVMSELDEDRRRALIRVIGAGGQVLVTTTDLRYFSREELTDSTVVELTS